MTRRERVRDAIFHRETDIIPYTINFTKQEHDRVAEYLGDPDFEKEIGSHVETVDCSGDIIEITPHSELFRDHFGVIWNRSGVDKDIGVIQGLLMPEPETGNYVFPEPDEAHIRASFENLEGSSRDVFRVGALGFSLFERAWTLRGMENLLTDMVLEPLFVESLMEKITEYNLRAIDIGLEYDMDGFHFGDDWGQQSGLIMGPDYWRKYIKPYLARIYGRVRDKGLFVSQHSCGDIQSIFPDLIDIGLNVYQTFQPEIYDMEKVKNQYGSDLTFWGGISTQRLLPFASAEEVRQTARRTMRILGKGGGYIAAPTHAVPGDVPPENIAALIEVFRDQQFGS